MQNSAIGLPWYKPGNFMRIRAICSDGNILHDTYNDWLQAAERRYERLIAQGKRVIKTDIDPTQFEIWCVIRGIPMDFRARRRYAEMIARQSASSESTGHIFQ